MAYQKFLMGMQTLTFLMYKTSFKCVKTVVLIFHSNVLQSHMSNSKYSNTKLRLINVTSAIACQSDLIVELHNITCICAMHLAQMTTMPK